jgi:glycosyltransferase involved in cell wall biosynthesis
MDLSIAIIYRNGEDGLERTLQSIDGLDAEILVYDCSSTGDVEETAIKYGARYNKGKYDTYEHVRFQASQLARFDWILMLHSDDIVDTTLLESLKHIDLTGIKQAYRIQFKNYFGNRWMRYGELGKYSHIRLANRKGVQTDGENIHEEIFQQPGLVIRDIRGYIVHRVVKNMESYAQKTIHDALLWAARSHRHGKKAGIVKLFFSPMVSFIRDYFFKLGFLDGWQGYICAKMGAWYTFLKYARLRELNDTFKKKI